MDKKGIGVYLAVAFGGAVLLEGGLAVYPGAPNAGLWPLLLLMPLPALAMWVARRFSARSDDVPPLRFWPVPALPAVTAIVGIPLVIALGFVLTAALGWSSIDWHVARLMEQLPSAKELGRDEPLPPMFVFGLSVSLAFVVGPTLFALLWSGGEAGWRGYLLPKLEPLGRVPAALATGFLWALWFLPYYALHYDSDGQPKGWLLGAVALLTAVGVVLAEVWRRWRHVGLTAVCYGAFVAQESGAWPYLFPEGRPPFAGTYGLVHLLLWAVVALVLVLLPVRSNRPVRENAPEPVLDADTST